MSRAPQGRGAKSAGIVKFRRLVYGVPRAEARGDGAEAAARFAQALGLDLAGLFIEDETLLTLSEFPFAAEVASGGAMRRIERGAIERSYHAAASRARGRLAAAAAAARVAYSFEAHRGTVRETAARALRAGDVVAFSEPEDAFARACHNAAAMLEATLGGPAAVLIMPAGPARRLSGVAAYLAPPDKRVLEAAVAISAAMGVELTLLARQSRTAAAAEVAAVARRLHVAAPSSVSTLTAVEDMLLTEASAPELAGQLLVLPRAVARELGIAALRHAGLRRPAPILIL